MEKRRAEARKRARRARLIVGVALIAAAVGVFLLTDSGRRLLAHDSAATPASVAAAPTQKPEEPEFLPEADFLEAAAQNGLDATPERMDSDARSARFRIALGEESVMLTLSLEEGLVTAFTLEAALLTERAQDGASSIEGDIASLEREHNARTVELLCDAFVPLALALDSNATTSRATVEALLPMIDEAASDGESGTGKAGECAFTVYGAQEAQGYLVTVVFAKK